MAGRAGSGRPRSPCPARPYWPHRVTRGGVMARLGGMYGPDATFLGVPRADLADPASWAGTDIMIIGAPFDGGTSHRPGARCGPEAIRTTDYLPHDGSRPHLPLAADALVELALVR